MLTEEQKIIVKHKEGPALVTAGPGTGKTHVLCQRIQYLLKNKTKPEQILFLTFSRAAAANIETRLVENFSIDKVECSTIHAAGLKIIMENWSLLGFTQPPKMEKTLCNQMLENVIKQVVVDYKVTKKNLWKVILQKFKGVTDKIIEEKPQLKLASVEVLKRYREEKRQKNLIDFLDMLALPVELFKRHPDVLKKIGTQVEHILVDEVQDMTLREYRFLYRLAKYAKSSVLVGDQKQRIYQFRGSTEKGFNKFMRYLNPVHYNLTQTFRLPVNILPLVNAVGEDINTDPLLNNPTNKKGFQPRFFNSPNNDEQLEFITNEISSLLDKGVPASEIAILGRTKKSLTVFAHGLKIKGVDTATKYRTSKGEPVKVLKALVLITRWVARRNNGISISTPTKALTRLLQNINLPNDMQAEIHNAICELGWNEGFKISKKTYGSTYYDKILELRKGVEAAAKSSPEVGTQKLIDVLMPFMRDTFGKSEKLTILSDFSSIKVSMRNLKTWGDFCQNIFPEHTDDSCIELTTCHAAKGKEWKYVFLINMVEGEFPIHKNSKSFENNLKAERNLFYVAISRAKTMLFIIQNPVCKESFTKNAKRHLSNLKNESSFIRDYKPMLRELTID